MGTKVRRQLDDLDAAAYLARLAGYPRCAQACRLLAADIAQAALDDDPELALRLTSAQLLIESLPL